MNEKEAEMARFKTDIWQYFYKRSITLPKFA